MVNLYPILEGHVLVCNRRRVPYLQSLTEMETLDLWVTVRDVARVLELIYKKTCSICV